MPNYRKFGNLAFICPNLTSFDALPCRQMLLQNNTRNLLRLREFQSNRIGFLSVGSLPIGICHTVYSLCDGVLRNRGICRNCRLFCYVAGKNLADFSTQLRKAGAVRCGNTAMRIGWNVQQQTCIRTNGIQIDVQQFACRANVSVLLRVVKPTCSDGGIHLGRIPDKFSCIADDRSAADVLVLRVDFTGEFSVIRLLRFRCRALGIPQLSGNHAPLSFPAMSGLVAAPAHIGTADIQNRIRLQFAQYCIVAFPIVNLLFAVFALTTGTVKPEAENISVVCCKLSQLGNEIIIIRFPLPIACIVTIPRGEIGLKINDTSPDELGFLARTIDNMVNEIGLLAQRWSDDQRKMRELELQTLQYQINPHFLFNTLNTLKWIATLNHVTPVSHGIDALSSLLQSTLIKKDELIPFDDELRNLKNYCDIQQLRYAGRFEMEYQIEDAAGYWTVPRFILQPLVENSILHGTADEDDFVTITVRATVSENLLTIHISDTGCGFDPSAIKEKNSERFSGIGLSNVDERMRLHYGNEYGLTIESAPGIGTQCILCIPNEAIR